MKSARRFEVSTPAKWTTGTIATVFVLAIWVFTFDPYDRGRFEAVWELAEGRPTIYAYGTTIPFENLNRWTGLRYSFIAGCEIDAAIEARAEGHNDVINAWIKAHGDPPNSFKRWEKEIFDPSGYFKTRLKAEKPTRLIGDGTVVTSLDAKSSIRSTEKTNTWEDGTRHREIKISVNGVEQLSFFDSQGACELFWGPKGSRFAIVRAIEERNAQYLVLDLERNTMLRMDWDHR